jgi:RimJ/RimL family protein N-acetyltransferase
VIDNDLPIFFEHQLDSDAAYMAAFTAKDPSNRKAFEAHWNRIRHDDTVLTKTILFDNQVAGHILSYQYDGRTEVSYWLGKAHWSRGIATQALHTFLNHVQTRPLYARAAKDNIASIRVLQKCGFKISGEDIGFANARGQEIEELVLTLDGDDGNHQD